MNDNPPPSFDLKLPASEMTASADLSCLMAGHVQYNDFHDRSVLRPGHYWVARFYVPDDPLARFLNFVLWEWYEMELVE